MFLFLAFHFTVAATVVSLAATRMRKELMIHTTRIIIILKQRNAANKTSKNGVQVEGR